MGSSDDRPAVLDDSKEHSVVEARNADELRLAQMGECMTTIVDS